MKIWSCPNCGEKTEAPEPLCPSCHARIDAYDLVSDDGTDNNPVENSSGESPGLGSIGIPILIKLAVPAFIGSLLMCGGLDPPMVWQGMVSFAVGIIAVVLAVRAFRRGE